MLLKRPEINKIFQDKEKLIRNLLALPNAPEIIKQIENQLSEENIKRQEFYENLRPDEKKEFINGQVFVHSPARWKHLKATLNLAYALKKHIENCKCGYLAVEKALIRLQRNDFEPDIAFWTLDKAKNFSDEQMFFPPPDFVVEIISPSTADIDKGIKFIDYAINGVKEYWIVDPDNHSVEQYLNNNGKFELYQKIVNGTIESVVIKGFSVDVNEIFED